MSLKLDVTDTSGIDPYLGLMKDAIIWPESTKDLWPKVLVPKKNVGPDMSTSKTGSALDISTWWYLYERLVLDAYFRFVNKEKLSRHLCPPAPGDMFIACGDFGWLNYGLIVGYAYGLSGIDTSVQIKGIDCSPVLYRLIYACCLIHTHRGIKAVILDDHLFRNSRFVSC